MLTGFLSVIGSIMAILFYEMKRRDTKKDDPRTQNLKRYAQIDRDIVQHDPIATTLHASADLDELERLQNAGGSSPR